jgi:hypothetical protein
MTKPTTPKTATAAKKTPEQVDKAFWESVDTKTAELATALRTKVFPIVLLDTTGNGDYVVGYARTPDMITQLRLIDKSAGNGNGFSLEACSTALESLLIASESDKRIAPDGEDGNYWKGACVSLSQFMNMAMPVLKKK